MQTEIDDDQPDSGHTGSDMSTGDASKQLHQYELKDNDWKNDRNGFYLECSCKNKDSQKIHHTFGDKKSGIGIASEQSGSGKGQRCQTEECCSDQQCGLPSAVFFRLCDKAGFCCVSESRYFLRSRTSAKESCAKDQAKPAEDDGDKKMREAREGFVDNDPSCDIKHECGQQGMDPVLCLLGNIFRIEDTDKYPQKNGRRIDSDSFDDFNHGVDYDSKDGVVSIFFGFIIGVL